MAGVKEETDLHKACTEAKISQVKRHAKKSPEDVNKLNKESQTPLHLACEQHGFIRGVEELLKAGADIDAAGPKGRTPLMTAIDAETIETVTKLLQSHADVNKADENGCTALHYSCCRGLESITNMLMSFSASVNAKDKKGKSALYYACKGGSVSIVRELVKFKADVNACTKKQKIPLHKASSYGFADIARVLLHNDYQNSKTDVKCAKGLTPLDIAVAKGNTACVEVLQDSFPKRRTYDEVDKKDTKPHKPQSCFYQVLCMRFVKTLDILEGIVDRQYDVCFCDNCCRRRKDKDTYKRGIPSQIYSLPRGWCKFGLKIPEKVQPQTIFKEWHVAFHGTKVQHVKKILESDFLMPGDRGPDGELIAPPPGHYGGSEDHPPPEGHAINKIFLSPSIKYAGCGVYAKRSSWNDSTVGGAKHKARVALQVRVKPKSYTVSGETIGAETQIDPHFPNSELEWSTDRRCVVYPVGLMIQLDDGDVTKQDVQETSAIGSKNQ